MKNKKAIAIAISFSIFASSFSGIYISYAKDNNGNLNLTDNNMDEYTMAAPTPYITSLDMEKYGIALNNTNNKQNAGDDSEEVFKGKKTSLNINNSDTEDMYHLGKTEIEEFLQQGYSIQDIFKADEIGNSIYVDPKDILSKAKSTGKSLDDVKNDIIKDREVKAKEKLKTKYELEYKKLINNKISEDDTINFLAFIDANNIQVSDDLIQKYKKNGKELFKEDKNYKLKQETKNKYQLSDKDTEGLSENMINKIEEISKTTGDSVKDIIKSIKKNMNN